jgi:hypothetical protein
MDVHILSLRSRRQNRAWGGARQRGTPGTIRIYGASPRSGRQLFVILHYISIEIVLKAAARFAGSMCAYAYSWVPLRSTPGSILPPAFAG